MTEPVWAEVIICGAVSCLIYVHFPFIYILET